MLMQKHCKLTALLPHGLTGVGQPYLTCCVYVHVCVCIWACMCVGVCVGACLWMISPCIYACRAMCGRGCVSARIFVELHTYTCLRRVPEVRGALVKCFPCSIIDTLRVGPAGPHESCGVALHLRHSATKRS